MVDAAPSARLGAAADEGVPGASGSVLFVLAHHDDEVFCAGHIHRALAGGARVLMLWATAGGLAPAGRRLGEGARVRDLLRLPDENVRDLELPDRAAVRHVAAIAAAADALLGPTDDADVAVFVPAFEGGHPDHDAVNLAVALLRAGRPGLTAFEFPLYRRGRFGLTVQARRPPAGRSPRPFAVLDLDEDALALRRRLTVANASQRWLSLIPLLTLARWAGRGRAEPARPLPAHDYTRPPQRRPLLYELYTRCRFEELRAAARATPLDFSDPRSPA